MSNPKPLQTDDFLPREGVAELIRDLAVRPPVKGMANVKAATDVFAANQSDAQAADTGEGSSSEPSTSETKHSATE